MLDRAFGTTVKVVLIGFLIVLGLLAVVGGIAFSALLLHLATAGP